jgi:hypothetical protein
MTATVCINNLAYEVRFPMRPLKEDEMASLRQSITKHGLWPRRRPTVCTISGVRVLIDGLNRATVCQESGTRCEVDDEGELSEAAARELAFTLNVPGRHLSPAELDRLRSENAAGCREDRSAGMSLRAIAAKRGVHHSTVEKYVNSGSTVGGATLERDDESCPLPPGVTITPPDPPGERFTVGVDDVRRRIAPAARPSPVAMGKAEIDKLIRAIKETQDALEAVLEGPGGPRFRKEATRQNLILTPDGPYCPALLLLRDVAEAVAR